jgi:hypothetical protein
MTGGGFGGCTVNLIAATRLTNSHAQSKPVMLKRAGATRKFMFARRLTARNEFNRVSEARPSGRARVIKWPSLTVGLLTE